MTTTVVPVPVRAATKEVKHERRKTSELRREALEERESMTGE